MRAHFKVLAIAALLLFACLSASATLTVYNSQSIFDSNVSNKVTTTFEGESAIYGQLPLINTCFADSTNVSCITINNLTPDNTPVAVYLTNAADRAANPGFYDWGTGDLMQGSHYPGHNDFMLNSPFFGIDLGTILGGGGTVDICVTVSGNQDCSFSVVGGSNPNFNFWGITSDGGLITDVTMITTQQSNDYLLFDNVQYQFNPNQPNPIPEPASLVLFGSGILAAATALRKRVKR